jgi:hypothetical protein
MREPTKTWFFQPRPARNGAGPGNDDSAPGLIGLPPDLLQRHGARVLDPGTAAAVDGFPPPRSTFYRARTLLIPGRLAQEQPTVFSAFNDVLGQIGMRLIAADQGKGSRRQAAGVLPRLPRPAILAPALRYRTPVVIDAWVALQALRAATPIQKQPEPYRAVLAQVSLEHLLIGSAITGSPADSGGGGISGGPSTSNDGSGPTSTDSYLFSAGATRLPVTVLIDPPARMTAADCANKYGRRPRVAVLDTGVRAHPWLDVTAKRRGYDTNPHGDGDGFTEIDPDIQHAIRAGGEYGEKHGDQPRQVIRHPWDTPASTEPLLGELASDTGHSTFIAGIIRQLTPDARVLAIRAMHPDGIVYEGDLLCALQQLANRIASAQAGGDPDKMVDVVSLSLGYFSESPDDQAYTSALWQAIEAILDMGVIVVAAAGNFATSRMFYPAAFAQRPAEDGQVPLISVGALNPNGSKAMFSDGGGWVRAWASGALVVSTLPTDINASRSAELRMRAHPDNPMPPGVSLPGYRAALDPDDYSCGFGIWSGTSFSAPLLAARIIRSLLKGAAKSGLRLDPTDRLSTTNRALAALKDMDWEG